MSDDQRIKRLPGAPAADGPAAAAEPPGKRRVVVTYLEMTREPPPIRSGHRAEKLALMRAEEPTLSFYRYLYEAVGGPWSWYERREMDDDALTAEIRATGVEVFVLYVGGVPAGFYELDCRQPDEVELKYFGLIPDFIGRGLGQHFLDSAVRRAWSKQPRRVWVNTCSLDHPGAIALYQKLGFRPYRQEVLFVDEARLTPDPGP